MGIGKEISIGSTETLSALPIEYPPPQPQSAKQKHRQLLRFWINAPIRVDLYLEVQLLALAFATGLEDATTFPDFFCYTSNQTGNTISLSIGIAGLKPGYNFYLKNVIFSLALFIIGCWAMGQTGNYVGATRRLWVLVSSLIQTAMVFAAGWVMNSVSDLKTELNINPSQPWTWSALALLAFSAGGQVAMARGVRIPEISTANASSAYVDLLVDPNLYAKHNRSRNRRLAFLVILALGCIVGAFLHEHVSSPITLIISGAVKLIVTFGFAFNKSEDGSLAPRSELMLA
jgi:uncharacterized membrane protein YoaK (UPF0700 family)